MNRYEQFVYYAAGVLASAKALEDEPKIRRLRRLFQRFTVGSWQSPHSAYWDQMVGLTILYLGEAPPQIQPLTKVRNLLLTARRIDENERLEESK